MRIERDALGERGLDESLYYGIQTLRAKENFSISGKTIADIPGFVADIARIKKAAALANHKAGVLGCDQAHAIARAADEVITNPDRASFVVDIYHGGGGTSANMNVNEVLANRANEVLTGHKGYDAVHPNTHVNMGQSTNDVIPAAMKMTVHTMLGDLVRELQRFTTVLKQKENEFAPIVKIGRTCLQDALPITLGQQFSGYRSCFERMATEIRAAQHRCLELPLGATAVGTEFGSFPGYKDHLFDALREMTGVAYTPEGNLFDGLQNADVWIAVSSSLKAVAVSLNKVAADLRILSSGPRAGLGELKLPAVQPGSSIMPGKVNPVLPEMAMQVYFRVLGNDVAVTRACEGELDLNVWESLILNCISESCMLLVGSLPLLAQNCIHGILPNESRLRRDAESSLALSTVVATLFDYEQATKVAKKAERENKDIKQVVVELGLMGKEEADLYLNPMLLTSPDKFNVLFREKRSLTS